jgi:N-acetyl-anhydromuramyl-L-alanine amidase AmpD
MTPEEYNQREYDAGRLTWKHITAAVKRAQLVMSLDDDGMCGPETRGHLLPVSTIEVPQFVIDDNGWLRSMPYVTIAPMHKTWHGGTMRLGPRAIVAHYTATDPGTGMNMARNRKDAYQPDVDRLASWHVTVDTDMVIQMASFNTICWHAGSGTVKPIPGIGFANQNAIGIELCGHGKVFPESQVMLAASLWRAIVTRYKIPRALAMVQHGMLDPTRRSDPGPVWMKEHAETVLQYAYNA